MENRPDISQDFAAFTVNASYDDIPEAARERAKQSILDTLGVIIAASSLEPSVKGVADLVHESGGREESTVLGFGGRAPAMMAAFANGAMAHCLDFDDHAPEGHHPSSSIVPSAFALAERTGGVSGKEMITAVALAQDLFLRLRRNVSWRQDWHLSTVVGVYSATAACARILKLNQDQVVSAFGIAGTQASGTMELAYGVGSDLRGMYAGFVSKAAVLSALMAEKGIAGIKSMFEGKAGFFNTYFDGKYDRENMLDGLGHDFSGSSILFKPWPACGVSHTFVHATTKLMQQNSLTVDDIEEIRVFVGDFQERLCLPIERRRAPKTSADAKFSIPFCVGLAAAHGTLCLADFTLDALDRPEVIAAANKVVAVADSASNWTTTLPDGRIEMTLSDGRILSCVGDDIPGSSEAPMDWHYLTAKFRDAASFSRKPLATESIDRAQEMIRSLETIGDAASVIRVLS
jgi:2-methylcitrate dehydratase PrpD